MLNPRTSDYQRIHVEKPVFTVGRFEGNDLTLSSPYVSGKHFAVTVENDRLYLEDTSKNGTFIHVNGAWRRISGKEELALPASLRITDELLFRVTLAVEAAALETRIAPLTLSRVVNIQELGAFEIISVLDICGSSELANCDEQMAFHLKKRMTAVAKEAFDGNAGSFYKSTGDGFLATYQHPSDALRACLETLYHLKMRNQRSKNLPIHVRIGLHAGMTYRIDTETGDLHGNDVNIAFRVEELQKESFQTLETPFPEKDRVLCTKAFHESVMQQTVSLDVSFVRCGIAHLK
ncbi:MAG: FHA domain-containing protein, partial [Candidatus Sumerlaeota bacterium]|nr:FHA domain-containing protein [Candidatus Sumerlaeota bacterium]